jgi:hypothetical protein
VVINPSISHETPQGSGRTVSEMWPGYVSIPLNRVEVAAHTESDQYPTPQATRSGSYFGNNSQGRYKAHKESFNADVGSGPEK